MKRIKIWIRENEEQNLYLDGHVWPFCLGRLIMAEQTSLWLFEGILLSLTEHNAISAALSTYCVVKQKKPSMSPTYPIKRSTTQTMANPIVYFRALFACCNKRKEGGEKIWSITAMKEGKKTPFIVSEGKGSFFFFFFFFSPFRTIMSESYIESM